MAPLPHREIPMKKRSLLLVDDESDITALIANRLDTAYYTVEVAADGREALAKISAGRYDLVTIDLMLPHTDGWELCRHLRRHAPQTMIIIVSALAEEDDRFRGYELGADDYIAKPFSPKELALKIEAMFRRSAAAAAGISPSGVSIDEASGRIFIEATALELTPGEYTIFRALIKTPKKLFSRDELAELIYYAGLGKIDGRNIDSHIAHIRKKYAPLGRAEYIRTVHGRGYRLHEE